MLHLRALVPADLPAGLRLSTEAGWNQLEGDWRRALALEPDGCFAAAWDGQLVGTTTTCILGSVAWVAMVLVDPLFRRRGIGRALMERALEYLEARGAATVRLDATPLGEPLYAQLGFTRQFVLTRFEGTAPSEPAAATGEVRRGTPDDWGELIARDRAVTGTCREKLLRAWFAEHPGEVHVLPGRGVLKGFVTARPGRRAWQIGPCLGESGAPLLNAALARHAGEQVFVDVPEDHQQAVRLMEAAGLSVQRRLVRMCRGEPVHERLEELWASGGPEKG